MAGKKRENFSTFFRDVISILEKLHSFKARSVECKRIYSLLSAQTIESSTFPDGTNVR
jgi:hypothetical protein